MNNEKKLKNKKFGFVVTLLAIGWVLWGRQAASQNPTTNSQASNILIAVEPVLSSAEWTYKHMDKQVHNSYFLSVLHTGIITFSISWWQNYRSTAENKVASKKLDNYLFNTISGKTAGLYQASWAAESQDGNIHKFTLPGG